MIWRSKKTYATCRTKWWVLKRFKKHWIFIYPRFFELARGGTAKDSGGYVPPWYALKPKTNTIQKKERRFMQSLKKSSKKIKAKTRKQMIKDYILGRDNVEWQKSRWS